jgi:hypothetical protein
MSAAECLQIPSHAKPIHASDDQIASNQTFLRVFPLARMLNNAGPFMKLSDVPRRNSSFKPLGSHIRTSSAYEPIQIAI